LRNNGSIVEGLHDLNTSPDIIMAIK